MVRAHVFFTGMVQGIGFRYTCRNYAVDLGLKGWVKNLADGRVELVAEGPKEDIESMLKKIRDHFDGYIRDAQVAYQGADRQFTDFTIAF